MSAAEPLGQLVDVAKGKKPDAVALAQDGSSRRVLQINDLRGEPPQRFTKDSRGVEARPSDVLIAWDGANAGTVGWGLEGYIGSTIARLRLKNPKRVFAPYLGRFLAAQFKILNAGTTGATIPHVDGNRLLRLRVPLPPEPEQRRIAAILDQADELRRKREESIRLMDELVASAYLTLVGPKNKSWDNWPLRSIETLAEPGGMRTGPFGSALRHSEFVDSGIAVLGIDNAVQNRFAWGQRRFITAKKYELFERYTVKPGDVIVTIMGTTGRSAVVPDDIPLAITTKHLAAITLKKGEALPEYVAHAIHGDPFVLGQIRSKNRGAIMEGLNLSLIRELQVHRPPLPLQEGFQRLVMLIRAKASRLQEHSFELDSFFQSLLHRAFRAEL